MLKNYWYAICLSQELEAKPIGTTTAKQTDISRILILEHRSQNGVVIMATHQVNITALV